MKKIYKIIVLPILLAYFSKSGLLAENLSSIPIDLQCNVEREELISSTHKNLLAFGYVYLVGFGGMGKSRLALDYSEKYKNDYSFIWSIDARQDIHHQLEKITKNLVDRNSLRIKFHKTNNSVTAINFLDDALSGTNKKALLIIDSTENNNPQIYPLLNKKNFHYIVTSRENTTLPSQIKVDVFSEKETSLFLRRMLPSLSEENIKNLSQLLGNYPLAVSQTVYYLKNKSALTLCEYISSYKHSFSLTSKQEENHFKKSDTKYKSVRATVRLSMDEIIKTHDKSSLIFSILSLLKNQNIPKSLILKIAGELGISKDEANDILSILLNQNFLEISEKNSSEQNYKIHEVVQESILSEQKPEDVKKSIDILLSDTLKTLTKNKDSFIAFFSENLFFIENAFKILKISEDINFSEQLTVSIRIYLLDYLIYIKRDHQRALDSIFYIFKKINIIQNENLKARFFSSAGDVLSLHKSTEKITKDVFDEMKVMLLISPELDNFEKIRLQNSIAQNLLLSSKTESSVYYTSKSLKLIQDIENPETIIPTYYFAIWTEINLGNYKNAITYAKKAIGLFDQVPDTAIKFYIYNYLSLSYIQEKDYNSALEMASKSVKLCKEYFGEHNADVLGEALTYKAESECKLNSTKSGIKTVNHAIKIYDGFYKNSKATVDQSYSHMILGDCLLLEKRYSESYQTYAYSLSILKELKIDINYKLYHHLVKKIIYILNKQKKHYIAQNYSKAYNKRCSSDNTFVDSIFINDDKHNIAFN